MHLFVTLDIDNDRHIYIFGRLAIAIASVAMTNLQLFSKIRRGNVHLSLVSFWPVKLTQLSEYCWHICFYLRLGLMAISLDMLLTTVESVSSC